MSRGGGEQPRGQLAFVLRLLFDGARTSPQTARRTITALFFGAILSALACLLGKRRRRKELRDARENWHRHIDLSVVQAVLMSAERVGELGRVEKRTLFVKSIAKVFKNTYILEKIVQAAQRGLESGDPFFLQHLEANDKWHVLTECQNHLSSLFAPYHIFFNEANRTQSYYRSAWYCLTLTCHRTKGPGRFFITPFKPVGHDIGMVRIRLMVVSEKELREICTGDIEAPTTGFFSSRHQGRWQLMEHFAELFKAQLQKVDNMSRNGSMLGLQALRRGQPSFLSVPQAKDMSNLRNGMDDGDAAEDEDAQQKPEENNFLRIHIPFPSSKTRPDPLDERTCSDEIGTQDVVLFE